MILPDETAIAQQLEQLADEYVAADDENRHLNEDMLQMLST